MAHTHCTRTYSEFHEPPMCVICRTICWICVRRIPDNLGVHLTRFAYICYGCLPQNLFEEYWEIYITVSYGLRFLDFISRLSGKN